MILDIAKHELLTNNWSNNEENDQVAYMSRGRTNKKDQSKENTGYTNRGRSMSRSRKPIVCYNCFKKGHVKKECRSPAYCQDCRQEHKPGSADCKNAWKYGQLSRDHRKDKNGNYGYEPQVRRDNNYRYSSQQRSGNQYYNENSNQFRNPQRGNYKGRGTYRHNYNQNYRPNSEDIQRYEENFNKTSENFDRVNTLTVRSGEQILDNYEDIHNWDVKDDYEDNERNFQ